jgi:hypothetical protein
MKQYKVFPHNNNNNTYDNFDYNIFLRRVKNRKCIPQMTVRN